MPRLDREQIWEPRQKIIEMAGFSKTDFENFVQRHQIEPEYRGAHTYYPMYDIMFRLNQVRKSAARGSKAASLDLDAQKKYEEVAKLRIVNQERMGKLIPRERARTRVLTLLSAFAQKLRYTIKNTAAQVVGMNDARAVENIMTQNYNNVIEMLEAEARILTWGEDSASSELGRTELPTDTGKDSGDRGNIETEVADEKQPV